MRGGVGDKNQSPFWGGGVQNFTFAKRKSSNFIGKHRSRAPEAKLGGTPPPLGCRTYKSRRILTIFKIRYEHIFFWCFFVFSDASWKSSKNIGKHRSGAQGGGQVFFCCGALALRLSMFQTIFKNIFKLKFCVIFWNHQNPSKNIGRERRRGASRCPKWRIATTPFALEMDLLTPMTTPGPHLRPQWSSWAPFEEAGRAPRVIFGPTWGAQVSS